MRVDRAGVDDAFVAPDVVEQPVARLHTAAPLQKRAQKFELDAGEMDAFAGDRNLMPRRIDVNGAGRDRFFAQLIFRAAQDRLDAQNDFARTERLGHVIVRAKFQTGDAIELMRLRRQHHDRNVARGRVALQDLANFQAGHFRQHKIENNERRFSVRALCKPAAPSVAN